MEKKNTYRVFFNISNRLFARAATEKMLKRELRYYFNVKCTLIDFQISKYPIQLVMLTTLVDLAVYQSAKCHIKKWKSVRTGKGYLESVCEIWRREMVRFNFIGQG